MVILSTDEIYSRVQYVHLYYTLTISACICY